MASIPIRSAALVVNTRSRKGQAQFASACQALDALGIRYTAHHVDDPRHLGIAVQRALAQAPDALILGGGDGTISAVVDHLVGQDVPLGLLPLGTANSFARSLGLPLDLDEAINIIAAGHCRRIDLGRINGDYFANCAALGMSALMASTIPDRLKSLGGRLGYWLWAIVQLVRFRPFRLRVGDRWLDALEVRIANGSYQGGAEVIPGAEVDSGEIVVQIIEGRTRAALVRHWLASLGMAGLDRAGHGSKGPGRDRQVQGRVHEVRARQLEIDADPPQAISIDGEVLAHTPVTVSIMPGAIGMILPPAWAEDRR